MSTTFMVDFSFTYTKLKSQLGNLPGLTHLTMDIEQEKIE